MMRKRRGDGPWGGKEDEMDEEEEEGEGPWGGEEQKEEEEEEGTMDMRRWIGERGAGGEGRRRGEEEML